MLLYRIERGHVVCSGFVESSRVKAVRGAVGKTEATGATDQQVHRSRPRDVRHTESQGILQTER